MTTAPTWTPSTTDEVVEVVATARADQRPLEVVGSGSVLDRLPRGGGSLLSTRGLTGIVEHRPADLIVTVRAGTSLDVLAAELAAHGQECPIEPIGGDGATVGGRLATALAGPRQLAAGHVRDWVLRVRFVSGTATPVSAGGVTVKDVTGFDLCRLLTGSWATIGVLTEVTLKLRPIPPHRAWYVREAPHADLTRRLYRPATVVTTGGRTYVQLEEHPDDAAQQAACAGLRPAEPPELPRTARAALDPARVPAFLDELPGAGDDGDDALQVAVHDQLGLCHLDGGSQALAAARAAAERHGGTLLVLDPSLGLSAFGPAHQPGLIAARVAACLDPDGVLAPWRWQR